MFQKRCMTLVLALTLTFLPLVTASAADEPAAFPEPALVTSSWNLDFQWDRPQSISYTEVDGSIRWFWFLPYKVVNNTRQDVLFIPEVTIATDTGEIVSAGEDVPPALFDKINAKLENPLLESPIEVVGKLLQGEDYARESVIVWPAFEENVTELSIFIAGLNGETQTVKDPVTGEQLLLRRTLELQFELPGNPRTPEKQTVIAAGSREVMR